MNFATPVRYLRIGMPLAMILASVMVQQLFSAPLSQEKLLGCIRLVFFVSLNFEAGRFVVLRIQEALPGINRAGRRFLLSYAAGVLVSFLVISLSTITGRLQVAKSVSLGQESLVNFVQCIWIAILIVTPLEVLYSYRLLYESQAEKNALEKKNLENQLQNLQEMVNPHFLFNTLNTLSSLVTADAAKAENYILELSRLYRQMLENNRRQLITLGEEIAFVQSYLYLVKERYLTGLEVHLRVQEAAYKYWVTPLTLQILIENAIKHNVISPEKPLLVTVAFTEGQLTVTNTIQPKQTAPLSSGIGLYTLGARYQLLGLPPVRIEKEAEYFTVYVSLLKPSHEDTDC